MEQEFGNGWAEGVHPDDFNTCLQTYVMAFDKREPFLMEYRMKNRHGEYRWIRDFGRPFYDLDDSFLGYIGSCYDVTAIKDNEQRLIELNATKDKFFSIIAHDLKSPFSSIVGFSELLVEGIGEKNYEKITEYADFILAASKSAMDLITNLVTWAQSQSGRLEYKPEYVDVAVLVSEALQLLSCIAEHKSVVVSNEIAAPTMVYADKEMLSTVLRNLISNALKFTDTRGGVTILSHSGNDGMLTVRISDQGVGISEERMDKLFNITQNYSTPGTHNEKGTGLGLILCKEFVERNGGSIWAESRLGAGSTFSFTLPVEPALN
jgi:signal transduction histidine kinase